MCLRCHFISESVKSVLQNNLSGRLDGWWLASLTSLVWRKSPVLSFPRRTCRMRWLPAASHFHTPAQFSTPISHVIKVGYCGSNCGRMCSSQLILQYYFTTLFSQNCFNWIHVDCSVAIANVCLVGLVSGVCVYLSDICIHVLYVCTVQI